MQYTSRETYITRIRLAVAAAREGSFVAAAELVPVSPPSLPTRHGVTVRLSTRPQHPLHLGLTPLGEPLPDTTSGWAMVSRRGDLAPESDRIHSRITEPVSPVTRR